MLAQTNKSHPSLAVVGVGHELRGDDGAGIMTARRLRAQANVALLIVDAGTAPENFTGMLRNFSPDVVLMVDAVHMDKPHGTIQLFDTDDIEKYSVTTHQLSCHLFADYLKAELGCSVQLLGIQIEGDELGDGLSPEVERSVSVIVEGIKTLNLN